MAVRRFRIESHFFAQELFFKKKMANLTNDLKLMHKAFKAWYKKQKKFFVVYWLWTKCPYIEDANYFWRIDIFPGIGKIKKDEKKIVCTSIMGGESTFFLANCKVFSSRKDAVNFREEKRKELYNDRNLFNSNY